MNDVRGLGSKVLVAVAAACALCSLSGPALPDAGAAVAAASGCKSGGTILLARGSPYGSFAREVNALSKSAGKSVRRAALALKQKLARLDPRPTTAYEAIGRVALVDRVAPASVLSSVESATKSACGASLVSIPADLAALEPAWTSDGLLEIGDSIFGDDDCSTPTMTSGAMLAFQCRAASAEDGATSTTLAYGSSATTSTTSPIATSTTLGVDRSPTVGSVVVVDLRSGALGRVRDAGSGWRVAGDRVVWISEVVEPAKGLQPTRFTSTLEIAPLDGSTPISVKLVDGSSSSPDALPARSVTAVTDDRIVVSAPDATGTKSVVKILDLSGREIASIDPRAVGLYDTQFASGAELLTTNSLLVSGSNASGILDLATGKIVPVEGYGVRATTSTGCTDRRLVIDSNGALAVSDNSGVRTAVAPTDPHNGPGQLVRPTIVVGPGDALTVNAKNLDGSSLWALGSDVVRSWQVIAGWVVVQNRSGEVIVVDPKTGKEATDLDPAVAATLEAAFTAGGSSAAVAFDVSSSTKSALVKVGETYRIFDLDVICPS